MTLYERSPPTVAVSTSESPDMGVYGLSEGHLHDAMSAIALNLLAYGRSVAYGGDLRTNGFTELLFELTARYRGHPEHRGLVTVTDYLAWPVHIRMSTDELDGFCAGHEDSANLVLLARDGRRLEREQRRDLSSHEPDEEEWTDGLTTMRTVMRNETQARIVLGGRLEGYKGRMPGIAEETLLSLQSGQPIFLLGGFGGCARAIAETIGLVTPWSGSSSDWPDRACFEDYSPGDLHNGLSEDDNGVLARTPHIHQAVALVSGGLRRILDERLKPQGGTDAQGVH